MLQSVSFVRADMEEGVKQLDKMAPNVLKESSVYNQSSHTCTAKARQSETQCSAPPARVTALLLLLPGSGASPLPSSKSGSGWLCGLLSLNCHSRALIASSLQAGDSGELAFRPDGGSVTLYLCCRHYGPFVWPLDPGFDFQATHSKCSSCPKKGNTFVIKTCLAVS